MHQRRVSQAGSIQGDQDKLSIPERLQQNEHEFIDLVEDGGQPLSSLSNYDKRFIKNMKADILDSQMVYRPKRNR